MELEGKNVIFLGGFGGIGRECVKRLLRKGIKNLAIFDLKEDLVLMQELLESFAEARILFFELNITDKGNIESAYRSAIDGMKHVDIVVNCCGIFDDRRIELTIQINLIGLIHSSLCALRYMDKSSGGNGGLIVNISSVLGLEPSGLFAAYSASKAGVISFTRAMANPVYYEATGVGFITICPGCTATELLLENPYGKETLTHHAKLLTDIFVNCRLQTPNDCAKSIIETIESGKNGSVWIVDLGELKELEIPVVWKPTKN